MSLARVHNVQPGCIHRQASSEIMFSIWWLIWAFVIGGYTGMLLISLLVLARRMKAPG
jgi:hypothetical protein